MAISTIFCYINACLAIITNGLLIALILRKSPRSMGNYKYLMLIFSTFGNVFAFIDSTNQPMLHFYDGAYVIFSKNILGLPRKLSFWYIDLNCACYSMILLLLVFHFVYRYFAVCKPHRLELFTYPYFNFLIGIFLFISLEWWLAGLYVAGENPIVEEHIRETMLENYGLTRLEYTYASSWFYRIDPVNGQVNPSLPDFLFLINLIVTIIAGFSVIFYCWLKLRQELINSSRNLHPASQKTLEMQRQLFRSLIAQTLFPTFLMFIPAGVLLCFPILRIDMGPIEVIIIPLITTQPFMDAIVPMYFIKDYRTPILAFFRRTKRSNQGSIDNKTNTSRIFSLRT